MRSTIVVRKYKAERIGNWILLILLLLFSVYVCTQCTIFFPTFLMSLLLLLPVFFIALYYETWSISLSAKNITYKSLLFTRVYSYNQITDAYTAYSATNHDHICLLFFDGKRIRFRIKDENGRKAKIIIQSHCSIRESKW